MFAAAGSVLEEAPAMAARRRPVVALLVFLSLEILVSTLRIVVAMWAEG